MIVMGHRYQDDVVLAIATPNNHNKGIMRAVRRVKRYEGELRNAPAVTELLLAGNGTLEARCVSNRARADYLEEHPLPGPTYPSTPETRLLDAIFPEGWVYPS